MLDVTSSRRWLGPLTTLSSMTSTSSREAARGFKGPSSQALPTSQKITNTKGVQIHYNNHDLPTMVILNPFEDSHRAFMTFLSL